MDEFDELARLPYTERLERLRAGLRDGSIQPLEPDEIAARFDAVIGNGGFIAGLTSQVDAARAAGEVLGRAAVAKADERRRAEQLAERVQRAVRDIRAGIPVRLIEGDPAIPLVREALAREDEK